MRGDICFYSNTSWFSRVIQWVTRSPYNHVAIDMGDDVGVFAADTQGVKVYPIDTPTVRVHTSLLLNAERMDKALAWAFTQTGKRYDYTDMVMNGVVLVTAFFHIPFTPPFTPQAYDCSELAATYLVNAGYPFHADFLRDALSLQVVNPGSLYRGLEAVQTCQQGARHAEQ